MLVASSKDGGRSSLGWLFGYCGSELKMKNQWEYEIFKWKNVIKIYPLNCVVWDGIWDGVWSGAWAWGGW